MARLLWACVFVLGWTVANASAFLSAKPHPRVQTRRWMETTTEETEDSFKVRCRQLCQERNLPFDSIKNARDLHSAASRIQPGRLYRMGRVAEASDKDLELLQKLDFKTLVDLRSPTELKDDRSVMASVFDDYVNVVWIENSKCVRVLDKGEFPVKKQFWKRKSKVEDDDDDDEEDCGLDCGDAPSNRKERHFVSLMNEFKYVKGTVSRIRKRDLTKALLKSPGAAFSKRVRSSIKKPFLDEINDGGLPMLNELLLRFGAKGIKYVLELASDRERHPVAFYCTAGKDRTGILAALILAICGVEPESIVEDYSLSANVYAEMNDHKAMVGALSQRSLDPKTFLGAPPQVMRDTLAAIEEDYGSVEGYCDWIGFGPEQREQLRKACLDV